LIFFLYYLGYSWRWCIMPRAVPSVDNSRSRRPSSYWQDSCPQCLRRPGSRWWSSKDRYALVRSLPAAYKGALACLCDISVCPICLVRLGPKSAAILSSARCTSFYIRTLHCDIASYESEASRIIIIIKVI